MWVKKAAFRAVKDIMSKMEEKVSKRKPELKEAPFLTSDGQALRELEAEQPSHALRASMAIHSYALMDNRIWELFFRMFPDQDYSGSLLSVTRFLQLVLDRNSRTKAQIPYGICVPIVFAARNYFHVLALHSQEAGLRKMRLMWNEAIGMLAGNAVQIL